MAEPTDLTRWNRAGLSRFRYVNGNAATHLEFLRAKLAARFPAWDAVQTAIPAGETESGTVERLETQYQASSEDMLWNLMRSFTRSAHILTETADAYANEAYLGTATQWDNVRRLVEMLDYHPSPPASAYTPLVLQAKVMSAGTVSEGFQVKYAPSAGEPVVFETLEDIEIDSELNAVRPLDYNRNPQALGGNTLTLQGKVEGLKTGEPIVLENESDGTLKAYSVQGVAEGEGSTTVTVSPALSDTFTRGHTLIHVAPKDKLAPLGPKATGAVIARSLQLSGPSSDLQAGEAVLISTPGKKPYYRRIRYVEDTRLVFTENVGDLDLTQSTVSRPVILAVAQHGRRSTNGGSVLNIVYAAGDWTRLIGLWVADQRTLGGHKYLPLYEVTTAKYVPPGTETTAAADDKLGYTALTLRWNAADDAVDVAVDLSLANPQSLLVPPVSPGPWKVDAFLQKNSGHLSSTVVTALPKKSASGDLAVLVEGGQLAWTRLQSVEVDLNKGEGYLRASGAWQDRGGDPWYLSRTLVYSHFKTQARLLDWETNDTPLAGNVIAVASLPPALVKGKVVLADNGSDAVKTTVTWVEPSASPPKIHLQDALPAGSTAGNLSLYGNVVMAGHGETRPEKALGSGDATQSNQAFPLKAAGISFVPDAGQASGVRADMEVKVDGQIWEQVSNLKDSNATDIHYTVRMTEDQTVMIGFGDGANGRRLPSGFNNLRVQYRQGTGTAGNVEAGSLVKPVKPHRLIDSVIQPMSAGGGADMEDVKALRESAPATVLTLERAVSLEDFALLMRSNSSVWQARAFALPTGFGQRENIEVVVIPAGGAVFTPDLKSALEAFVLASALPGVQVKARAYEPVLVSLQIVLRIISAEYDTDAVSAEVTSKLQDAFSLRNRDLGQSLYRGELYKVVEAVTGVENSDCRIVFNPVGQALTVPPTVVKGIDGVIRLIRPADRQCIHLNPDNPQIAITVEEYAL